MLQLRSGQMKISQASMNQGHLPLFFNQSPGYVYD